ncbi:MAG: PQQ-binding-like beta-propeller repeat protein [Candidatus Firestonebacteria bacterium]
MKKNVNFAKKLFINISILLLLQILVLGIKNSYCTGLYWQVASPNGNRFMTTPAVATIGSDTVVYSAVAKEFWGSSDCVLYAFTDAGSSASLRWSYNLSVNITYGNGAHISNIIVDNGVLYIGPGYTNSKGSIIAINADTGAKIWEQTANDYRSHYVSLESSTNTLFVVDGKYVRALDTANSGEQKWQTGPYGKNYILSISAVSNNTVYIGTDDFKVYAINASNGALKWSYTTGREVKSTPVRVGNLVYFGSNDGYVYCVLDNENSASLVWQYKTTDYAYVRATPEVTDGTVYIGSEYKYLYALDANTGSLKWKFKSGKHIQSRSYRC